MWPPPLQQSAPVPQQRQISPAIRQAAPPYALLSRFPSQDTLTPARRAIMPSSITQAPAQREPSFLEVLDRDAKMREAQTKKQQPALRLSDGTRTPLHPHHKPARRTIGCNLRSIGT